MFSRNPNSQEKVIQKYRDENQFFFYIFTVLIV